MAVSLERLWIGKCGKKKSFFVKADANSSQVETRNVEARPKYVRAAQIIIAKLLVVVDAGEAVHPFSYRVWCAGSLSPTCGAMHHR